MSELKTNPAGHTVEVSLGYTVNMQDYESARIDIRVSSAPLDGENVRQTFDRVYGFVESRLAEKVSEQRGEK